MSRVTPSQPVAELAAAPGPSPALALESSLRPGPDPLRFAELRADDGMHE